MTPLALGGLEGVLALNNAHAAELSLLDHDRLAGLARQLYAGAFAAAGTAGQQRVAAEVNRIPPNPASDALHAALGFQEVGQAVIHGGARTVRYLVRDLP